MSFFHITLRKYLPSITMHGLVPNIGHTSFVSDIERYSGDQPIFLTDDPEYIIRTQLTKDWVEIFHPILLEVDVVGLLVQPHLTTCYHENHIIPHEFVVREPIPALRLSFVEDIIWKNSYQ